MAQLFGPAKRPGPWRAAWRGGREHQPCRALPQLPHGGRGGGAVGGRAKGGAGECKRRRPAAWEVGCLRRIQQRRRVDAVGGARQRRRAGQRR
eukprot:364447-Chlamydomonas_euryale.AAC.18